MGKILWIFHCAIPWGGLEKWEFLHLSDFVSGPFWSITLWLNHFQCLLGTTVNNSSSNVSSWAFSAWWGEKKNHLPLMSFVLSQLSLFLHPDSFIRIHVGLSKHWLLDIFNQRVFSPSGYSWLKNSVDGLYQMKTSSALANATLCLFLLLPIHLWCFFH